MRGAREEMAWKETQERRGRREAQQQRGTGGESRRRGKLRLAQMQRPPHAKFDMSTPCICKAWGRQGMPHVDRVLLLASYLPFRL